MRSGRSGTAATRDEDELLASCYRTALTLAAEHGSRRSPFPRSRPASIAFPPDRAARIAVGTVAGGLAAAPGR